MAKTFAQTGRKTFAQKGQKTFAPKVWLLGRYNCHRRAEELADIWGCSVPRIEDGGIGVDHSQQRPNF